MISSTELLEACRRVLGGAGDARLDRQIAAAERVSTDPLPFYRLAFVCRNAGQLSLWDRAIHIALALPHLTNQQLYYRAEAKLILNDWSGWTDYEARLFHPEWGCTSTTSGRAWRWSRVMWDRAEALHDLSLLVMGQGGFGDFIHMLRFVPPLVEQAHRVIVACPPVLVSFVRHNLGKKVTIVMQGHEDTVAYDRYTWMTSLPGSSPALPTFAPLAAPHPLSHPGRGEPPLQVGICWASGEAKEAKLHRSIPFSELSPLLARDDVQWYSLQVGAFASESDACSSVQKPARPFYSFADTANFLCALDAVVTVDTAVAHLAGSLGVPTFLLLWTGADWRWGVEDRTPWYPSIEIIRQIEPDRWGTVIACLMHRLDALTTSTAIETES